MPARLNRRRYREVVVMLKELISDKKQPAARRLQAGQTLLAIYERHDRTEARKRPAESAGEPEQPTGAPETPEEAADRLIASVRQRGSNQ